MQKSKTCTGNETNQKNRLRCVTKPLKAQVGFECAVPAGLSFAVLDPIHGKAVGVVLGRLLIKGIKNSPSGKWKMIESTQDGLVVRDRLETCL